MYAAASFDDVKASLTRAMPVVVLQLGMKRARSSDVWIFFQAVGAYHGSKIPSLSSVSELLLC